VGALEPLTYLALNGSLGTGFREESLEAGLARPIEFVESIPQLSTYERDLILGGNSARLLKI